MVLATLMMSMVDLGYACLIKPCSKGVLIQTLRRKQFLSHQRFGRYRTMSMLLARAEGLLQEAAEEWEVARAHCGKRARRNWGILALVMFTIFNAGAEDRELKAKTVGRAGFPGNACRRAADVVDGETGSRELDETLLGFRETFTSQRFPQSFAKEPSACRREGVIKQGGEASWWLRRECGSRRERASEETQATTPIAEWVSTARRPQCVQCATRVCRPNRIRPSGVGDAAKSAARNA
jgi:hypothetical protein